MGEVTVSVTRRYVPLDLDVSDWGQLEPLYQELLARPLDGVAALRDWLRDYSELSAVVGEFGARRHIEQSCHTEDAQIEKAFMHWVEEISPRLKPIGFELEKKFIACPHREALGDVKFTVMAREWAADVELFRAENVPLETQATKTVTRYDKLVGAMMVEFDGKTQTLQQMARYQEEPDRAVREEAWTLSTRRRLADRAAIDDVFDELLELRGKIANNAGFADYRSYAWKSKCRFDYTPEDCLRFGDAIATAVVPLVEKMDGRRRALLGVEALRPWDLAVDPRNRPALKPFASDDVKRLVEGTREVFGRVSPALAADFGRLQWGRNLDLDSRRGKRAGGYQSSLLETGEPFIFMNAVGLQRDVETLLHEGGHAFHFVWGRREPLVFLQSAPIEFCEVASMSMELIGSAHFDVFYADEKDAARARRALLEGIVRFFPWMAQIDGFQHGLYGSGGAEASGAEALGLGGRGGREKRAELWGQVQRRFASKAVDWSGLEEARATLWQRQIHLFHYPFYYVEYGIAQLGALQLWRRYREDPGAAMAAYRAGLELGGTRPLPELFAAAGLAFDFSEATLGPLMKMLGEEIEKLPE